MTEPIIPPTPAEHLELDVLLERGVSFTVPKRSILRFLGKPERTFVLAQPYLGTLDCLSAEYIKMNYDEQGLEDNFLQTGKSMLENNPRLCARVIAIAVLGSEWKIKLFTGLLAHYFLWRVTPRKLIQLTLLINQLANLADFTTAIRFLSPNRTTRPNRIAKQAD